MGNSWWNWRGAKPATDAAVKTQLESLRQRAPVPVIWMFGKTGSGKSSVVRFLTGAEAATIGEGYRPETKTSQRFDFPDSEDPLLTFIDTRGLAEAAYDPSDDLKKFAGSTQLMIVTVRVTDQALESVLDPLRRIRRAAPERPVLLLVTCLHEATGTSDLSAGTDPFTEAAENWKVTLPPALATLLDAKAKQFEAISDALIPVDLTPVEDGFAEPNFGGERLKHAILDKLPQAYRQAILALADAGKPGTSARHNKAHWQVLASSALAATAGAVPLPWVDIPVVLGIQAHLAMKVAKIHDQEVTPARWAALTSAAGSRVAIRLALRGVLKFIPFAGMAVGAASSFAITYALGMSCDWYFSDLRKGNVPSPDELKRIFADQLRRGHELWSAK